MITKFEKGQIIKHYKRKPTNDFNYLYKILVTDVYMTEENDYEDYIVYQALYGDNKIWCRPTGMFYEMIDGKQRFTEFTLGDFYDSFCAKCKQCCDLFDSVKCISDCPYYNVLVGDK